MVKAPDATHYLRFIEGRGWEYAREPKKPAGAQTVSASGCLGSVLLIVAGFIVAIVGAAFVLAR
jgi:hypothetical protein